MTIVRKTQRTSRVVAISRSPPSAWTPAGPSSVRLVTSYVSTPLPTRQGWRPRSGAGDLHPRIRLGQEVRLDISDEPTPGRIPRNGSGVKRGAARLRVLRFLEPGEAALAGAVGHHPP